MTKKFNEVTEEFIKAMSLYDVKELKEMEDRIVMLDVLQRKKILNAFLFMVSACVFFGLNLIYSKQSDFFMELSMQGAFFITFLIGAYLCYKGLEVGNELSSKVESFNLAKGLYIDSVKKAVLEIPAEINIIVSDLMLANIYTPEESEVFKKKIKDKTLADSELIRLAFELRTEKTKLSATNSTTISLDEHRKNIEG